jgi:hypothetical protein
MKTLILFLFVSLNLHAGELQETLFGYLADDQGLTVQVYSGGCTAKEHFQFLKSSPDEGEDKILLTLVREVPDWCKAFVPRGVSIRYTWKELEIDASDKLVELTNPVRRRIDVSLIQ